MRHNINFTRRI